MKDQPKTLTPKRRFPEFRDGREWNARELGPLTLKVGSGITPLGGETNYKTSGRPFIRSQNVGWGELILDDVAYIDDETHRLFDTTELAVDDVLLNITGASIGRSAVADSRISGGNVNQHVCIIRVKEEELDPALLNQYLISDRGQKQIDSFQAGGNRQGLNFGQIRSFEIPLPPTTAEQRKIAGCLTSLDELLAAEGRKLEALRAHKQGLMQQLFPPEGESRPPLRVPEFRDGPEWETRRFLDLVDDVLDFRGRTPKKLGMEWGSGDIISLSANNVKKGFIDYDAECNLGSEALYSRWMGNAKLEKGDIVFTMEAPLGNALLVPDSRKYILSQRVVAFKTKPAIANEFLIQLIWSDGFQAAINLLATGSTAKGISQKALQGVEITLPCENEQQRIAACLSLLDALITAQSRKLDGLRAHKKGLMQQLFPSPEGN